MVALGRISVRGFGLRKVKYHLPSENEAEENNKVNKIRSPIRKTKDLLFPFLVAPRRGQKCGGMAGGREMMCSQLKMES